MDIVNLKKLHFFEQNVKIPTYEFYKVNWTSPFNEKYKRYVEPGLTAINKKYIKISYKKKLYLVSIKTYNKLCAISNPINFYVTNTNEYISKNNLEKIKSKTLTTSQLTTLYLYQSQFYYDYWNNPNKLKKPIQLDKKANLKSNSKYYKYLENYEFFITSDSFNKSYYVIILFGENNYKIKIISSNDVKICDSLYAINWADIKGNVLESKHIELYRQTKDTNKPILPLNMTKPIHEILQKRDVVLSENKMHYFVQKVIIHQKYILDQFYYITAEISYPRLNKYKNFKKVDSFEVNENNLFVIPQTDFTSGEHYRLYKNNSIQHIVTETELAKYIYNANKKKPSTITYYKFINNEIFEPIQEIVFYRGMNITTTDYNIFEQKEFVSMSRDKNIALAFMDLSSVITHTPILYEITLEKGVPYIDFKILGQNTLYFEEELLLLTSPCKFEYEEPILESSTRAYFTCKVSISIDKDFQYKFKNLPDIERFKEFKLIDNSESSSSFNISSSQSSINSINSKQTTDSKSFKLSLGENIEPVVMLEDDIYKQQYIVYKRTNIQDESVYIEIDSNYYEVSGVIKDTNKKQITNKITYEFITSNYNNFVYLSKYSPIFKKLKLIKFMIKETKAEIKARREKERNRRKEERNRRKEERAERAEKKRAEKEAETEMEAEMEAEAEEEEERAEMEKEEEEEEERAEMEKEEEEERAKRAEMEKEAAEAEEERAKRAEMEKEAAEERAEMEKEAAERKKRRAEGRRKNRAGRQQQQQQQQQQ